MSVYSFNGLTLNISNFNQITGELIINEKNKIADPITFSGLPTTTLMGCGKKMDVWNLEGWATPSDFATLFGYYKVYSNASLTINSVICLGYIKKLDYKVILGSTNFWYTMDYIYTGVNV